MVVDDSNLAGKLAVLFFVAMWVFIILWIGERHEASEYREWNGRMYDLLDANQRAELMEMWETEQDMHEALSDGPDPF